MRVQTHGAKEARLVAIVQVLLVLVQGGWHTRGAGHRLTFHLRQRVSRQVRGPLNDALHLPVPALLVEDL